jgi:dihydrofolate reductase
MTICVIVAMSEDRAIGRAGKLPWYIPEDMKYFRQVTMGCPVIMGRKTWVSIGKPLDGRKNIVLSKSKKFVHDDVVCAQTLDAAIIEAKRNYVGEIFIIGGATIYEQALSISDKLYITHVLGNTPDADTFFPYFDKSAWAFSGYSAILEKRGYDFLIYKRR